MSEQEAKEMWALVELFGHNRVAGKVTEAEIGGGALIRVEIPAVKGKEALTKYYNVKAIYGITPVDEATARRMAESIDAAPINSYSIDREIERRKQLGAGDEEAAPRLDPSMPRDEIRLEHPDGRVDKITNVAAPSGVVEREDVIERALDAYYAKPISGHTREQMAAAARVIQEARDAKTHKAIIDIYGGPAWEQSHDAEEFATAVIKRLNEPAHPQADRVERVTTKADEDGFTQVFIDGERIAIVRTDYAERYAAGLRAELTDAKEMSE